MGACVPFCIVVVGGTFLAIVVASDLKVISGTYDSKGAIPLGSELVMIMQG